MRYTWLDEYLLSKKGVSKDHKAEWNWTRYMIDGKMFAAVCYDDDNRDSLITLKLDPLEGDLMRSMYEDVIPGYYMNKEHWNSIKTDGAVPDEVLRMMLDKAYGLILGSLSKKRQREILSE